MTEEPRAGLSSMSLSQLPLLETRSLRALRDRNGKLVSAGGESEGPRDGLLQAEKEIKHENVRTPCDGVSTGKTLFPWVMDCLRTSEGITK